MHEPNYNKIINRCIENLLTLKIKYETNFNKPVEIGLANGLCHCDCKNHDSEKG